MTVGVRWATALVAVLLVVALRRSGSRRAHPARPRRRARPAGALRRRAGRRRPRGHRLRQPALRPGGAERRSRCGGCDRRLPRPLRQPGRPRGAGPADPPVLDDRPRRVVRRRRGVARPGDGAGRHHRHGVQHQHPRRTPSRGASGSGSAWSASAGAGWPPTCVSWVPREPAYDAGPGRGGARSDRRDHRRGVVPLGRLGPHPHRGPAGRHRRHRGRHRGRHGCAGRRPDLHHLLAAVRRARRRGDAADDRRDGRALPPHRSAGPPPGARRRTPRPPPRWRARASSAPRRTRCWRWCSSTSG